MPGDLQPPNAAATSTASPPVRMRRVRPIVQDPALRAQGCRVIETIIEEDRAAGLEPDVVAIGRAVWRHMREIEARRNVRHARRAARLAAFVRTAERQARTARKVTPPSPPQPRKVNPSHRLHAGCSSRQRRAKTSSTRASSTRQADDDEAGHHPPSGKRARRGRWS